MKPEKPSAKSRVTTDDLTAALANPDRVECAMVFDRNRKQTPTTDAIPILRQALADDYHYTVKVAALALRKLGPAAADAMDDLLTAAARIDPVFRAPQAYAECIEAMASIDPSNPHLVHLIKQFVDLDNWIPISGSLRALKTIGTPEALDLFERMAGFWEPELNQMQRRVVEQLRRA